MSYDYPFYDIQATAFDQPTKNITDDMRTVNDVLLGTGSGSNLWPGNKDFRTEVQKYRMEYVKAPHSAKKLVSLKIIEYIRNKKPKGRFLKRNKQTGIWFDVGDEKACEKVSRLLREVSFMDQATFVERMKQSGASPQKAMILWNKHFVNKSKQVPVVTSNNMSATSKVEGDGHKRSPTSSAHSLESQTAFLYQHLGHNSHSSSDLSYNIQQNRSCQEQDNRSLGKEKYQAGAMGAVRNRKTLYQTDKESSVSDQKILSRSASMDYNTQSNNEKNETSQANIDNYSNSRSKELICIHRSQVDSSRKSMVQISSATSSSTKAQINCGGFMACDADIGKVSSHNGVQTSREGLYDINHQGKSTIPSVTKQNAANTTISQNSKSQKPRGIHLKRPMDTIQNSSRTVQADQSSDTMHIKHNMNEHIPSIYHGNTNVPCFDITREEFKRSGGQYFDRSQVLHQYNNFQGHTIMQQYPYSSGHSGVPQNVMMDNANTQTTKFINPGSLSSPSCSNYSNNNNISSSHQMMSNNCDGYINSNQSQYPSNEQQYTYHTSDTAQNFNNMDQHPSSYTSSHSSHVPLQLGFINNSVPQQQQLYQSSTLTRPMTNNAFSGTITTVSNNILTDDSSQFLQKSNQEKVSHISNNGGMFVNENCNSNPNPTAGTSSTSGLNWAQSHINIGSKQIQMQVQGNDQMCFQSSWGDQNNNGCYQEMNNMVSQSPKGINSNNDQEILMNMYSNTDTNIGCQQEQQRQEQYRIQQTQSCNAHNVPYNNDCQSIIYCSYYHGNNFANESSSHHQNASNTINCNVGHSTQQQNNTQIPINHYQCRSNGTGYSYGAS